MLVTNKNEIDVNELWKEGSPQCLDMAVATMTRDRFKVLASSITFDDFHTRETR